MINSGKNEMKKTAMLASLILLLMSTTIHIFSQGNDGFHEFQVKAAFLQKFTNFIDWPNGALGKDKTNPFVIGVIAKNYHLKELTELYGSQKIKDRKIEFVLITDSHQIANCNLLYIVEFENMDLDEIITEAQKKPILIVSNDRSLLSKGIHIGVYIKREKPRFDVNETALKDTKLQVNYILLNSANTIVNPIRRRRR